MLIVCDRCNKQFKIPDEKLPNVQKFAIKCPSCGEKIVVNREKDGVVPEEKQDLYLNIEPEMYPPGEVVAFVYLCNDETYSNVGDVLRDKGYIISSAKNIDEAVAKLHINRYDMLFFEDNKEGDRIREIVAAWTGNVRREINVICLGDRSKTFDPNIEFILGVNSYISVQDIDNIQNILEECIKRHKEFLTPWNYVKKNEG